MQCLQICLVFSAVLLIPGSTGAAIEDPKMPKIPAKVISLTGPDSVKILRKVTYKCKARCYPYAAVKWTYNGQRIGEFALAYKIAYNAYGDNMISSLTFTTVKSEYKGILKCEVENNLASDSSIKVITISGKSRTLAANDTAPVIMSLTGPDLILGDVDASYQCFSLVHPQPTVDWTYNGKSIEQVFLKFSITTFSLDGNTISGLIVESKPAIAGVLKCFVKNSLGSADLEMDISIGEDDMDP